MPSVKIHPTVVFEILNIFSRRDERQNRVVGTLLGVTKDNCIEITECYVVPHHEKLDEVYVAIKKDYHTDMLNFRKQINRREQVVGWFSTTSSAKPEIVSDNCSLIHEFYSNECSDPVHIVVDTSLSSEDSNCHINIKGFMSKPLVVGAFALGNIFQEIKVETDLSSNEAETLCIYQMIHGQKSGGNKLWENTTTLASISDAQESFSNANKSLLTTIEKAISVLGADKSATVSPQVGVALADAMSVLHSVKKSDFDAAYQSKTDTLLMISYIASLTKTQLIVSEKLNAVL